MYINNSGYESKKFITTDQHVMMDWTRSNNKITVPPLLMRSVALLGHDEALAFSHPGILQ